jgi:hypothetical protein
MHYTGVYESDFTAHGTSTAVLRMLVYAPSRSSAKPSIPYATISYGLESWSSTADPDVLKHPETPRNHH